MDYKVSKTSNGHYLVVETDFVASFIDGRWFFDNRFGSSAKLLEVSEKEEASRFYERARLAQRTAPAVDFYRTMYSGSEPSYPNDFSAGGYSDYEDPDESDPTLDSARVPRRPSPEGGEAGAQVTVDDSEIKEDEEI